MFNDLFNKNKYSGSSSCSLDLIDVTAEIASDDSLARALGY